MNIHGLLVPNGSRGIAISQKKRVMLDAQRNKSYHQAAVAVWPFAFESILTSPSLSLGAAVSTRSGR